MTRFLIESKSPDYVFLLVPEGVPVTLSRTTGDKVEVYIDAASQPEVSKIPIDQHHAPVEPDKK